MNEYTVHFIFCGVRIFFYKQDGRFAAKKQNKTKQKNTFASSSEDISCKQSLCGAEVSVVVSVLSLSFMKP